MIAENLVSDSIVPLRTSDTGEEALEIMNEFLVRHLPIVNNEELLGLISEEDILDLDVKADIGSYPLSVQYPYVRANDHLYEVMRLFAEQNLTVVPVVSDDKRYLGMILLEELLLYF
jgi:CBS domain-containing protein